MLSSAEPQYKPHWYQKQFLLELGTSYPGIHLHCVGSSYTREYINNWGSADVQLGMSQTTTQIMSVFLIFLYIYNGLY